MARILIVEDDLAQATLIEMSLKNLNHEIFIASDAIQGIELAREIMPDLIYMDLSLPFMNGLEAIEYIRRDSQLYDIPVFLIIASRQVEIVHLAETVGANMYISKPFDVKHLRQETTRVLS